LSGVCEVAAAAAATGEGALLIGSAVVGGAEAEARVADETAGAIAESLAKATSHLENIGTAGEAENEQMLSRIGSAVQDGRSLTEGEQNFLTHETTEADRMAEFMNQGMTKEAAQEAAHKLAGLTHPDFANYDPEVILNTSDGRWNQSWYDYWGITKP
jgi:hypothetical protein